MMIEGEKPLRWMGSSRRDLRDFPEDVKDEVGHALQAAQWGLKASCAKPYRVDDRGGAGVLEIVEDYDTDTYRAVYTVRFKEVVYVLHCFQKKSKQGRETPQRDKDLIKARLKMAEEDYKQWKKEGKWPPSR